MDQPEQSHQAGPGSVLVEQAVNPALEADSLLQPLVQCANPIGMVVDGSVEPQFRAGLGEQADDQPHDQPHRRLVECLIGLSVGQGIVRTVTDQAREQPRGRTALLGHVFEQEFDGFTDILLEEVGQPCLAIA